jgi:hypothetical protein
VVGIEMRDEQQVEAIGGAQQVAEARDFALQSGPAELAPGPAIIDPPKRRVRSPERTRVEATMTYGLLRDHGEGTSKEQPLPLRVLLRL